MLPFYVGHKTYHKAFMILMPPALPALVPHCLWFYTIDVRAVVIGWKSSPWWPGVVLCAHANHYTECYSNPAARHGQTAWMKFPH